MKIEIYSPGRISFILATIVTIMLIVVFAGYHTFIALTLIPWWLWIVIPFVYLVTYALSYMFISKLLIHKVYPLYKIISQPKEEESFKKSLNILKKANVDVANWVVQKNNEIDRLKKNEKFRREFLSNVSHELKNASFFHSGLHYYFARRRH